MPLILSIARFQNLPPAQDWKRRFDGGTVRIGRAPENDFVLPDPDHHISKRHCVIQNQGGRYVVTDTSTNGVFLNGAPQPLGQGASAELHDGDLLTIGGYELLARTVDEPAVLPDPFALPGAGATPDLSAGPFGVQGLRADPPVPPAAAPPFSAGPFPAPPLAATPFGSSGLAGGFPEPAGSGLPDIFSIFETPAAPAAAPNAAFGAPPFGASPLGAAPGAPLIPEGLDWLGGGAREPFAAPPPQTPATQHDHVPSQHQFFHVPGVAAPLIPDNWDLNLATAPQPAVPPPSAAPPQAPAAAAPAPGDSSLFEAFLAGAGLSPAQLSGENPAEAMRRAGQILQAMTAGLCELLTTRAMVKTEYRVEQTVIRSANNNPLKFSADPREALTALLSAGRPGFMPGPQAVAEGVKDMKAHELALMAGLQSAVAALMKQFDPEQLKQRLESNSLLGSVLPGARKAKYWEIYEQEYRKILADVSEDVRGVFGRAFATAYEAQSRKL